MTTSTTYPAKLIDEAVASLRELVSVYGDEIRGGVPMPMEDQPTCIRNAMEVLIRVDLLNRK